MELPKIVAVASEQSQWLEVGSLAWFIEEHVAVMD